MENPNGAGLALEFSIQALNWNCPEQLDAVLQSKGHLGQLTLIGIIEKAYESRPRAPVLVGDKPPWALAAAWPGKSTAVALNADTSRRLLLPE